MEDMEEKTVDIMIQCDGQDDELVKIPLEFFTRIEYMARCQDKTFEQLFVEIIEEEVSKEETGCN